MSIVFIISAPSGTGKTTLADKLLESDSHIEFAISVTTRPPRADETDGEDYRFVSEERFDELRDRGAFLEWAEVFGHRYGTPRSAIQAARERGRDLLLDIDVQGASLLIQQLPEAVKIFILPPSKEMLANRLRRRSSDEEAEIRRRLGEASREVREYESYDYVVVNDEIEPAAGRLKAIVRAERSRRQRMKREIEPILEGFGVGADADTENSQ